MNREQTAFTRCLLPIHIYARHYPRSATCNTVFRHMPAPMNADIISAK